MSLNIDINRVLPVKVSGDCPTELSRLLILSQSCSEPWENIPLEFRRLSSDVLKIAVVPLGSYSCNSVFPSFVGFGMLKNFAETQHRIREDEDFCALKIDDYFVMNQ